jgi:hypothetical protein
VRNRTARVPSPRSLAPAHDDVACGLCGIRKLFETEAVLRQFGEGNITRLRHELVPCARKQRDAVFEGEPSRLREVGSRNESELEALTHLLVCWGSVWRRLLLTDHGAAGETPPTFTTAVCADLPRSAAGETDSGRQTGALPGVH